MEWGIQTEWRLAEQKECVIVASGIDSTCVRALRCEMFWDQRCFGGRARGEAVGHRAERERAALDRWKDSKKRKRQMLDVNNINYEEVKGCTSNFMA